MPSSGSHSGSDLDSDEELALRIALERSKVETGAVPDLQRRRSFLTGAARTLELYRKLGLVYPALTCFLFEIGQVPDSSYYVSIFNLP